MAFDINQVFLIGRLTKDPETRYASNTVVCKFSIANNSGRDESDVSYFDIVTFGKTAEMCQQFLAKGKQIAIVGRLTQNRWEKDGQTRSKVEIVATNIQFIGSKGDDGDSSKYNKKYDPSHNFSKEKKSISNEEIFEENDDEYQEEVFEEGDDDIPF
jgi:single-strand DNA-binding protein